MTQNPPPGAPPEAPSGPAPTGDPGPQPGPRTSRDDVRDLARMRRTVGTDRTVAGVAGGLARHLDVDPLILRVAFVVLVFFGGAGLIVYAACWLLVPEDGDDEAPFNFDDRTRSVALVLAGVIAALALVGDTMGGFGFPWPLALIAIVVLLVVVLGDRRKAPQPTAPPVPHAPPAQAAPPGTPVGSSQTGWVTPPATWQPRPPQPRKRGPILFWFTLALAALGVGILGVADLAGAGVADSAYPALVVAICGAMLLLGAFYGRAGGLIVVGLVAAIVMAGTTASSRWEERDVRRPTSAAAVPDRYEIGAGELIIDLTAVADPEALDGRTIEISAGVGSIDVRLPHGLDVDVAGSVGLGDVKVFGDRQDGAGVDVTGSHNGGVDVPDLQLDIELGLGEIDVNVVGPADGLTDGRTAGRTGGFR